MKAVVRVGVMVSWLSTALAMQSRVKFDFETWKDASSCSHGPTTDDTSAPGGGRGGGGEELGRRSRCVGAGLC
jgi:hypothetical protein